MFTAFAYSITTSAVATDNINNILNFVTVFTVYYMPRFAPFD